MVVEPAGGGGTSIHGASAPQIGGCEIQAAADKPIWVACLEGAGLWHEQTAIPPGKKGRLSDWKPPFPAKWRLDVLQGSGETVVKLAWRRRRPSTEFAGPASARAMLVYAMDRSQATPLTTFTPIDILRGTLGVGPCQYILQTEGLASDANPTPDNVMTWIEKQFSRKKEKKSADEIRERLAQMVEHVGQAQARIDQYRRMFAEVEALCDTAAAGADHTRDRAPRFWLRWRDSGFEMTQVHCRAASRRSRTATGRPSDRPDRQGWRSGRMREARRASPRPRRRAGSHVGRLPHEGPLVETVGRHAGGRSSRRRRTGQKGPIQGRGNTPNEVKTPLARWRERGRG